MAVPIYAVGTATLTVSSAAMVGQGTLWLGNVRPYDMVIGNDGKINLVATVNSNTSITLLFNWGGASQAAQPYRILYTADDPFTQTLARQVLQTLSASALVALGGLVPAARQGVYFDATAAAALFSLPDAGRALLANGGVGLRNKLINGNFGINQRQVSGTVALAAGAYGHDRWKAGASGCTYTFATVNNVTTLTISAGSLQQVIEGANLLSGTHVLSWQGTAQGKIGAGAYGASGVAGTVAGGANTTIEFSTGTLSLAQLEVGDSPTPFDQRLIGAELALCQRYFASFNWSGGFDLIATGQCYATTNAAIILNLPVPMRAKPTMSLSAVGDFALWAANTSALPVTALSWVASSSTTRLSVAFVTVAGGLIIGNHTSFFANSSNALVYASAEL